MAPPRKNALVASLLFLFAVSRGAKAVPTVTQVIDGLPQVIAPQQIIVQCNPAVLPVLCTFALDAVGAVLSVTGLAGFNLATLADGLPLQDALDALRVSSAISSAEPNRILIGSTAYPQTWHFPAMGAPGDDTLLPNGRGPLVAVVDTGIAYENKKDTTDSSGGAPALDSKHFAQGWNFVNDDTYPDDDNGHGTAMATIIAGSSTFSSAEIPYVGPAAGATLMPIKVLDQDNRGTEFWLEEGIRYAVGAGANVINLSLDFARNYVPGAALRDAIAAARDNGVVIVAATGNTGSRVLYPAAFPDVISVGAFALDAASGYAVTWYSNRGEALDLVAPGGLPGEDVNQDGLWDGVLTQSFPPGGSPGDISWWLFAGTSPAAAHASGAAAALIGNGVAPAAVRPLLQATADDLSGTGWDPRTGSGRIQAASAIAAASSYVPPEPLYADAVAALRADGRAAGAVLIATADGTPVSGAEVHVRWRGAAVASQTGATDGQGIARFVSPWPNSSRNLFVIEVPRVISGGAAQRPRAIARSDSGFSGILIGLDLSFGGSSGSLDGLDIWGYGYGEGVGLASGTTGSGLASGTTGSTGDGSDARYPMTTGIETCPVALPLYSYSWLSFSASWALFSGAFLEDGYSVRLVDSSWVMAPGAVALDDREVARICGLSVSLVKSLATSYFWSGTPYTAGLGPQPSGLGIGDNARFWADVMNTERSTAP